MNIEFQYTICNLSSILKSKKFLKTQKDISIVDSNYPKILRTADTKYTNRFNIHRSIFRSSSLKKRKRNNSLPDLNINNYESSDFIKVNRKTSGTIYKGFFAREKGIINNFRIGYEFYINAHAAQKIDNTNIINKLIHHLFNDFNINLQDNFHGTSLFYAKDNLKRVFIKALASKKNTYIEKYSQYEELLHVSDPVTVISTEGEYIKESLDKDCEHLVHTEGIDLYFKETQLENKNNVLKPKIFFLHLNHNYQLETFKKLREFILKIFSEKYVLKTIIDKYKDYEIDPASLNKYFNNHKHLFDLEKHYESEHIKKLICNEFIINTQIKNKVIDAVKLIYEDGSLQKYSPILK